MHSSTLDILTLDSPCLRGNPLGDPSVRRIPVWLPPSYHWHPSQARRYPVIYVLAGFASDAESLFQGSAWQPSLAARLNRLVTSGAMGEAIVVAPDGFNRYGGSQYLDSSATGNYESYICNDLIPAIDARYRTMARRESRAIAGKSSGGFGALMLGMHRPDLFSAIASHAADAYFELSILQDLPKAYRTLRRHDGIAGFLRHFDAAETKRSEDFTTIMILALSAAYAPDPSMPHGFALPFDMSTGEIVDSVWRRFKACDPVNVVEAHHQALRQMALVFLDAGSRDEWALDIGARILAERMRKAGVHVEHQEFDDGHRGTSYRYDVSFPKLASAIGAKAWDPDTSTSGAEGP